MIRVKVVGTGSEFDARRADLPDGTHYELIEDYGDEMLVRLLEVDANEERIAQLEAALDTVTLALLEVLN
jgi:hypothetical protein